MPSRTTVANLVPISPFNGSGSRRFGKTYTQFLTEIRIGHACKLLIENRISVAGKTPQHHQREHDIA